jgi:hypothetical protein
LIRFFVRVNRPAQPDLADEPGLDAGITETLLDFAQNTFRDLLVVQKQILRVRYNVDMKDLLSATDQDL